MLAFLLLLVACRRRCGARRGSPSYDSSRFSKNDLSLDQLRAEIGRDALASPASNGGGRGGDVKAERPVGAQVLWGGQAVESPKASSEERRFEVNYTEQARASSSTTAAAVWSAGGTSGVNGNGSMTSSVGGWRASGGGTMGGGIALDEDLEEDDELSRAIREMQREASLAAAPSLPSHASPPSTHLDLRGVQPSPSSASPRQPAVSSNRALQRARAAKTPVKTSAAKASAAKASAAADAVAKDATTSAAGSSAGKPMLIVDGDLPVGLSEEEWQMLKELKRAHGDMRI